MINMFLNFLDHSSLFETICCAELFVLQTVCIDKSNDYFVFNLVRFVARCKNSKASLQWPAYFNYYRRKAKQLLIFSCDAKTFFSKLSQFTVGFHNFLTNVTSVKLTNNYFFNIHTLSWDATTWSFSKYSLVIYNNLLKLFFKLRNPCWAQTAIFTHFSCNPAPFCVSITERTDA